GGGACLPRPHTDSVNTIGQARRVPGPGRTAEAGLRRPRAARRLEEELELRGRALAGAGCECNRRTGRLRRGEAWAHRGRRAATHRERVELAPGWNEDHSVAGGGRGEVRQPTGGDARDHSASRGVQRVKRRAASVEDEDSTAGDDR